MFDPNNFAAQLRASRGGMGGMPQMRRGMQPQMQPGIPPESQANLDAAQQRIGGQQQDLASMFAGINQSMAGVGRPPIQQPPGSMGGPQMQRTSMPLGIPPESQANLDAANARIPGQQADLQSMFAAINQSRGNIGQPPMQQPMGGGGMGPQMMPQQQPRMDFRGNMPSFGAIGGGMPFTQQGAQQMMPQFMQSAPQPQIGQTAPNWLQHFPNAQGGPTGGLTPQGTLPPPPAQPQPPQDVQDKLASVGFDPRDFGWINPSGGGGM